jgi:hypothetical protein
LAETDRTTAPAILDRIVETRTLIGIGSYLFCCLACFFLPENVLVSQNYSWKAGFSGGLDSLSIMSHQFSLSLSTISAPAAVYISLQHQTYSHISISHVSLLSPSQFHHSRLNHFRIHFINNEFEKTNWITTENTIHNN